MRTLLLRLTFIAALAMLAAGCGADASSATGERALSDAGAEPAEPAAADSADDSAEDVARGEAEDEPEPAQAEPAEAEPAEAEPEPAEPESEPAEPEPAEATNGDVVRCIVQLHGKGGSGGDTFLRDDGIVVLWPNGNGTGWGALQWEYDTDEALQAATSLISASMDSAECDRAVVHGFSNGASMTAALHCSGNNLDGRLVGVVVDDPVTDSGTVDCSPATDQVVLYWTGGLAGATAGTDCGQIDWTCAGGFIRGIDAYAADLGVAATQSPQTDHQWNFETPFPVMWLG